MSLILEQALAALKDPANRTLEGLRALGAIRGQARI